MGLGIGCGGKGSCLVICAWVTLMISETVGFDGYGSVWIVRLLLDFVRCFSVVLQVSVL